MVKGVGSEETQKEEEVRGVGSEETQTEEVVVVVEVFVAGWCRLIT